MQRRYWLLAVSIVGSLIVACADRRGPAARPNAPAPEVEQEIQLVGFDRAGEPVIRLMTDGSVYVVFNFMPPSDVPEAQGLGPFEDFDKQLERATGVAVLWEDREFFLIQKPKADTVERIRRFVEGYRRK